MGTKIEWRNPLIILALIGMLLIAGILALSLLRDRFVNQQQWQVSFSGQGKITYEPDIANINMGVQIDKKAKAEDALKELNEKIDKIFKAVEASGIDKKDIQTQSYSLAPHYDIVADASKLTGYDASQVITVKVRDILQNSNKSSLVIKAASGAGVNQINGISFEPSNLEELKQEARLKAIADAKNKAGVLAGALGVNLKKIVSWWENFNPPAGSYYGMGGGIGGGGGNLPNVPSGAQEIIVEVNINYQIK